MPLLLKTVQTARGPRWVADALRLFARRPMGFVALSMVFFFAAILVRQLPLLGAVIPAMSLPLLSLGFMVASHSALLGGPVKASHFIEPLRGDARRRRALLTLCVSYGVTMLLILLLADAMSNHAMARVQAIPGDSATAQAQVEAILTEPGVVGGLLLGMLLAALLSVPYWHAPALVYWGGQGVTQALFSSTLAVWRAKGAFLAYTLAWAGLVLLFSVVSAILLGLLGLPQLVGLLSIPAWLVFSSVFYISLLFCFNDSFGAAAGPDAAVAPAAETTTKMPPAP